MRNIMEQQSIYLWLTSVTKENQILLQKESKPYLVISFKVL